MSGHVNHRCTYAGVRQAWASGLLAARGKRATDARGPDLYILVCTLSSLFSSIRIRICTCTSECCTECTRTTAHIHTGSCCVGVYTLVTEIPRHLHSLLLLDCIQRISYPICQEFNILLEHQSKDGMAEHGCPCLPVCMVQKTFCPILCLFLLLCMFTHCRIASCYKDRVRLEE